MSTEIKTGNIPVNVNNSKQTSTKVSEQQTSATTSQTSPLTKTDTVSMTDTVSRLQEIESQLSVIPTVDSSKVAEIKQAIADGSFEINPESIASKLIEMESGVVNRDK